MQINIEEYIEYVSRTGHERKKLQSKFNQADFLAGAMCVFALKDKMDKVPAAWILKTLIGEDVFTKEEK